MVTQQKRDADDLFSYKTTAFFFKNTYFLKALRIVVLALFVYAIFLGYVQPDKAQNTFTTTLFWSLFWPLFMVVTLSTFGRLFCGICPHAFVGKYLTKIGLKKTPPKWLKKPLIGVLLLFLGWWSVYYIYPSAYKTPLSSALFFTVLSVLALSFFFIFKEMSYCKYICPIGTMTRTFSKISFTWLGTYAQSCQSCKTFDCTKACSYNLKPFSFTAKASMSDCTLCMDCAQTCESVHFKLQKPSSSLFKKFQTSRAEVWAILLITAAITITMSFHHALSQVAISDAYFWVRAGKWLQNTVGIEGIDYIGMSALISALISTLGFAAGGIFVASKILHVRFSSAFDTLCYAFIPIFIIGGLSHTYEFFFVHHYSTILNGFIQGFHLPFEAVKPLATKKDAWLKIFGILNYVAVLWALLIMAKRVSFFNASRAARIAAFAFASLLIFFYLGLNLYRSYAFATYGIKQGGHAHNGAAKTLFASVPKDKALLLQGSNEGVVCGMPLDKHFKTNHSATLEGNVRQYCSLHCLTEDLMIKKLPLQNIHVVDVSTLSFIDAHNAFYVVGSRVKGTMSETSQYAFAKEEDAQAFRTKNGGEIMSFEHALKIAMKDFE
ncbi:nitrous oxide reductase accessory protein NosL [Sulfurospirillum cavolei]|uniref:nitrous oxide reductase accessory protein NosL n=1 Tax=Sulfurospirillum cavolei TaxID=366522 RepID=UPI0009E7B7CD|nr:nitrous oxide reductase accessory protein NosL [Sulfurospirillum cavolei]